MTDADNEANLFAAISNNRVALELDEEAVITGNSDDYLDAYEALLEADEDFEFSSVQEINDFVEGVNAEVLEGLVSDVNDALGEGELISALAAINIENVIPTTTGGVDFPLEYFDAIQAENPSTVAEVQAVVDLVNSNEAEEAVAEAEVETTNANITDAQAVINALPADEEDETTVADFQDRLDALAPLAGVNQVILDATYDENAEEYTFNGLQTALENEDLSVDSVIATAISDYEDALSVLLEEDEDFLFSSEEEVQTFINEQNQSFIDEVNAAVADAEEGSEAADLFTALDADALNLTGVTSANTDAYYAQYELLLEGDADFEFTSVQEIQDFVNDTNLLVAANAGSDSALFDIAAQNDVESYLNLSSAQRTEVAADVEALINSEDGGEFTTLAGVISELDSQSTTYDNLLSALNDAETTTQMDVALEALENDDYEGLSSSEQFALAEDILNNQRPDTGFATLGQVQALDLGADLVAPDAPFIGTDIETVNNEIADSVDFNGTAEAGSTVAISVDDEDAGTAAVTYTTVETSEDGSFSQVLNVSGLTDGNITVTVTAEDASNNTSAESTETFVLDTVTTVTADAVTSEDTTVTGTGEAGSTVVVTDGSDNELGTAVIDETGSFSLDIPAQSATTELTFTSTDVAGNTATDNVTVTDAQ
ncbi:hypothetical protein N780_09375 [Pontibacillus chungwhensis BH030062]|uniref:Bacterial Ig domain-containing protein n=1 Tax=Pontibacillus chungwhensis BH030062 TaxID=1385513 RepID=A0A0A2UNW4_9BACI|nr:Ig-like domain-containing protein [Pontibacillus chungwhensis]KGP89639.1 hypothetical protein N780_09375 [Pontibacillus chungwhensis BH030062]